LAYKIQTPEDCPEENIQNSEHGKALKSRGFILYAGSSYIWINVAFSLGQHCGVDVRVSKLLAICHFVLVVRVYSSAGSG
jgi:hypothetical protein